MSVCWTAVPSLADARSAPPASQIPAIFTIVLSCLPLLTLPDHIDQVSDVLMELVKRDEHLSDGKMKLAEKLVKWLTIEVDNMTGTSRT